MAFSALEKKIGSVFQYPFGRARGHSKSCSLNRDHNNKQFMEDGETKRNFAVRKAEHENKSKTPNRPVTSQNTQATYTHGTLCAPRKKTEESNGNNRRPAKFLSELNVNFHHVTLVMTVR